MEKSIEECCVCYEKGEYYSINCEHIICKKCMYNWALKKDLRPDCPMCRTPVLEETKNILRELSLERKDACMFYTLELDITKEEVLSIFSDIDFKYGELLVKDEFKTILHKVQSIKKNIKATSFQNIKVIDKTCDCNYCKGYLDGTNKAYYSFKIPRWFYTDQDIAEIIRSTFHFI